MVAVSLVEVHYCDLFMTYDVHFNRLAIPARIISAHRVLSDSDEAQPRVESVGGCDNPHISTRSVRLD